MIRAHAADTTTCPPCPAAMRRAPRVESRAEVVAVALLGFAGVQTHTDTDRSVAPLCSAEGELGLPCRRQGVAGPCERRSERVTCCREDVAVLLLDRRPDDSVVNDEGALHDVGMFLPQTASTPRCP